jgi:ABC-type glycerol-3-phosphate transport system substrate-binding protein
MTNNELYERFFFAFLTGLTANSYQYDDAVALTIHADRKAKQAVKEYLKLNGVQ